MVGEWESTGAVEGSPLRGEAGLTLTESGAGKFGGSLRVGLAVLDLSDVEVDESKGTGKAKIAQPTLKVKGEVELKLDAGTLNATVKLTEPEQTISLSLARKAASDSDADKKAQQPRGVIDAIGERLTLGDVVLEDDALINEEKDGKPVKDPAPRYGGVSSIEWSTRSNEMLVQTDGDIYLLKVDAAEWDKPVTRPAAVPSADDAPAEAQPEMESSESEEAASDAEPAATEEGSGEPAKEEGEKKAKKPKKAELKPVVPYRGELTRLTRTRERESDVQYLPDGSGYTYLRGGALLRVSFGDHQIVQLDPELKDGERMVGYRISPDMKRLVFLATRGQSTSDRAATVTIVNYRDRFARAQEVRRHMPDDPWPESYSSVYLYDLKGHGSEEGTLERVFTRRVSGPRDVMRVPEWSPDSSRIAFAAFDQQQGHMKILEAGFKVEKAKEDEAAKPQPADKAEGAAESNEEGVTDEKAKEEKGKESGDSEKGEEPKEPEFKIENARVVYEFLHAGGPNTPGMVQPLYLPDSKRMVFITELSGFRQLHMLDPRYEQLTQVTAGQFELYPFHLTRDYTTLFATSTEGDPNQEQVYKIDLGSLAMTRLTETPGVYSGVAVREDGSLLVGLHTEFGSPTEL